MTFPARLTQKELQAPEIGLKQPYARPVLWVVPLNVVDSLLLAHWQTSGAVARRLRILRSCYTALRRLPPRDSHPLV